ncbi:hypothetical protein ACLOJK_006453 [Asimina triloba]
MVEHLLSIENSETQNHMIMAVRSMATQTAAMDVGSNGRGQQKSRDHGRSVPITHSSVSNSNTVECIASSNEPSSITAVIPVVHCNPKIYQQVNRQATSSHEENESCKWINYEKLSSDFTGYGVTCVRAKSDAGGHHAALNSDLVSWRRALTLVFSCRGGFGRERWEPHFVMVPEHIFAIEESMLHDLLLANGFSSFDLDITFSAHFLCSMQPSTTPYELVVESARQFFLDG